jgi:hypothetical protein
MRKTEKILIVLIIIGQLMRIFEVSGGSVISISAAMLLAFLYLFFGFALFNGVRFRNIFQKGSFHMDRKQIAISVFLGLGLAFSIMGIVFKLQILKEANITLMTGIIIMAVLLAILLKYWKNTSFYSRIIIRVIGYGILATILLATPAKWWVDVYYFRHPDYAESLKERLGNPEKRAPGIELDEE